MTTSIKCQGCRKDSGVRGGSSIGDLAERTKFVWIPNAGEMSTWFCRVCAGCMLRSVSDLIEHANMDLYTYPPTLKDMLQKYMDKAQ